jgi:hypothetical protein
MYFNCNENTCHLYCLKRGVVILLLLSDIYKPHSGGSEITHKDAPQSVGLLWTSDQPVA